MKRVVTVLLTLLVLSISGFAQVTKNTIFGDIAYSGCVDTTGKSTVITGTKPELAHLVFIFRDEQDEERMVDRIAGAFLLPQSDIVRELGPKRSDIRGDLRNIQREYGISMAAIMKRAQQTGIITKAVYETTMKWMSANGLRSDEKSGLVPEKSHLLEQLTSRAVSEDEIGISKAAEILEMPLADVRMLCYGGV